MNTIVVCRNCGARNRVKADHAGKKPICAKCRTPLPVGRAAPRSAIELNDNTFGTEVLSFPGTVIVGFWAPWCAVCPQMIPVWDGLAKQHGSRVKVAKVNVDRSPVIANRFDVRSIPTTIVFRKGRPVQTINGAVSKSDMERQISAIRQ